MMSSKMKILILSPFFFPEPISTGKFNTALAKALRDKGMEVTVICSHPFVSCLENPKNKPGNRRNKNHQGRTRHQLSKKFIFKKSPARTWAMHFLF